MIISCINHPLNEMDISKEQQIGIGKAIRRYLLQQAGYNHQEKTWENQEVLMVMVTRDKGISELWTKVSLKLAQKVPSRIQLKWMEEGMTTETLTDAYIESADKIVAIWNGLKSDTTTEVLKALHADKDIFLIDPDTYESGYLNQAQKQGVYN